MQAKLNTSAEMIVCPRIHTRGYHYITSLRNKLAEQGAVPIAKIHIVFSKGGLLFGGHPITRLGG
jgi:hypothetical protein